MNCLEFRRAFGADPQHASAALQAHRAQCPACEKYAQEILRVDGLIKRALEVPVPPARDVVQLIARPDRSVRGHAPWYAQWYSIAASVLLALGAAGMLWLIGYPRDSLANDVVAHLAHEPEALQVTDSRVSAELLDAALQAKGLHLAKAMSDVSYLQSCRFREHVVPHLVVQTERGPVTVLLLTDEPVDTARRFDEHGYRGMLFPMQKGSAAVIATEASLAESVAAKVRESIVWN